MKIKAYESEYNKDPSDENLMLLVKSYRPVFYRAVKAIERVTGYYLSLEKKHYVFSEVEFKLYEYYLGRPDFGITEQYWYIRQMVWNILFNQKAQKVEREIADSELLNHCYRESMYEWIEDEHAAAQIWEMVTAIINEAVDRSVVQDKPAAVERIYNLFVEMSREGRDYRQKRYRLRKKEREVFDSIIERLKEVI